jgi:hypothetical protein
MTQTPEAKVGKYITRRGKPWQEKRTRSISASSNRLHAIQLGIGTLLAQIFRKDFNYRLKNGILREK